MSMSETSFFIFEGLKNSQLYAGLQENDLSVLLSLHTLKEFKSGDLVIFESLFHREIHLLVSGALEVFKTPLVSVKNLGAAAKFESANASVRPLVIATLHPGECVGEFAVLNANHKGSASVRALVDSKTLRIRVDELVELCEKDKALGYRIFRNLSGILASRLLRQ
jgi:CRP-like cAMP-binding protein